ncbi:MAG: head GIN domain-containing protein [Promethearchaeota archaeon]
MKKLIIIGTLVVLLTPGLVTGCTGTKLIGSGNLVTKTYDYSGFTEIKAENGMHVELTSSDTFSVEVIADDNVIDYIEVNKSGSTLRIRPKPNTQFRDATLTAKITMPELYELKLSGGSHVNLTGFSSKHDLSVTLSGGSHLSDFITPSDITAGNVDFNLSGGSHVRLIGSADDLDINCSGGSHIDLEGFSADNADINLSGGSHATVNVSGTLDVDISGGSKVYYIGNPTMGDTDVDWDSDLIQK